MIKAEFLIDLFKVLSDNGIGEDMYQYIEYNDRSHVKDVLNTCLATTDRSKLDSIVARYRWDEEYDLEYDDMGMSSIAQGIGELFRKYNLMEPEDKVYDVVQKEHLERTYRLKCPACGNNENHYARPTDAKSCVRCGAKWNLKTETANDNRRTETT